MEIEIIKSLQAINSKFFDFFCKLVSHLGNYIGFILVFLLLFMLFNRKYSIYFGITYGISILANYILKYVINRPRPYIANSSIKNIMPGSGASMPSGHTLSATIIACFCVFAIIKKCKHKSVKIVSALLLTAFVACVMVSRMYLGQHYLSDTIVGFVEGIIFSAIGIFLYTKNERRKKEIGNDNKQ